MKKFQVALIVAGLLAGMAGAFAIRNWDPYRGIPQVTLSRLNDNETNWYAEGILDYRVLVSVAFGSEQRRYEIVVLGGSLSEASSSRFEEAAGEWGPFIATPAEEAGYFTVPGLFGTVRSALLNEEVDREVLRMEIDGNLSYPKRVLLGRILEEGFPIDGTDVLIEVLEFEEG